MGLTITPGYVGSDLILDGSIVNADVSASAAIALSKLATSTSSQLASIISDETGTDKLVFNTSPSFLTDIRTPKVTTDGAIDFILNTNNGTNSASIIINNGINGSINLTPNGTGSVNVIGRLGIKNTAINAGIDSVAGWAYDSTFGVTNPVDIYFKPDGLVMYLAFSTSITQYNLTVAWDITTAAAGTSFSMSLIDTVTQGLFISPDGTKMVTCGQTGVVIANGSGVASEDRAYYFTLGTPWDVSTATLVSSIRFALGDAGGIPAAMTAPCAVDFKNDGTIMYIVDATTDAVHQFALSSAYNVGTATWTKQFSISSQDTGGQGLRFNASGTRMYVVGTTGDDVNEYRLSTAWDIATAVFYDKFYVGWYELTPIGMYINESTNMAFVCGSTSDVVLKFRTDRQAIELDPETATSKIDLTGSTRVTDNFYVNGKAFIEGSSNVLGSWTIGNDLAVASNTTLTGDLAVNGGDLTTTATTFNLVNATATTVNFASAGTTISIGATTGTATIKNPTVVVGNSTTSTLKSLDATGTDTAAPTLTLQGGANTGNNGGGGYIAFSTGTQGSTGAVVQTLTERMRVETSGSASQLDLTTNMSTVNLFQSNATTVNVAGVGTTISIGAATGTTTINNNLSVGNTAVSGLLTTGSATSNLVLSTNGGTTSGTVTITAGANGNISLTPNGTGSIVLAALSGILKGTSGTVSAAAAADINSTFGSQTQNFVYAAPSGANGNPTFRALVAGDIPGTLSSLIITGNLTVNGTTTTINSNTVSVDDKNLELGGVASVSPTGTVTAGSTVVTALSSTANIIPGSAVTALTGAGTVTLPANTIVASVDNATQITLNQALTGTGGPTASVTLTITGSTDATANGGGITLLGATNKTIIWDSTNSNWTSSEHWNIASTKVFKINNVTVLDTSQVLASATGVTVGGTSTTTVALGTNSAALSTTTVGGAITGNILRINSAAAGTATFTTNNASNLVINTNGGTSTGNITINTGVNGNIAVTPNGTGVVNLGDTTASGIITTGAITANLTLSTNNGTTSGTVVITAGTNGNITIAPNGTGSIALTSSKVSQGISNTATTLTTNGTGNLTINTNSGTNAGSIVLNQGVNGNIAITPNGTGVIDLGAVTAVKITGGASTNLLSTNGSGVLSWVATPTFTQVYPASGIANSTGSAWGTSYSTTGSGTVVALQTQPSFTTDIRTPKVTTASAVNLVLDTNAGTTTGNITLNTGTNANIAITPNGTGSVLVGDQTTAGTVTTGTITANLTLNTNNGTTSGSVVLTAGANGAIVVTPNGSGAVQLVTSTTQLGVSNTATTLTTSGTGNLTINTNSGTNAGSIVLNQGVNGNIAVTPNGTGVVNLGDMTGAGLVTTGTITSNLTLNTNNGTTSGSIVITAGTNGNIAITPNGSGVVDLGAVTAVKITGGANGNVLTTNGSGVLSWASGGGGSMVYPASGIANSTGTAWGTSYSTTGSSTVVALGTSPSFVTDIRTPKVTTATAVNLVLDTNAGTTTGSITINTGTNGNITLLPNGTGQVLIGSTTAGILNIQGASTAGTATITTNVTTGAVNLMTGLTTATMTIGSANGGRVAIAFNQASTSTITGAVTIAGGLGVAGAVNAQTKSFIISHPTKPGKLLKHGSLEGPEFGVYVRGKVTGKIIELPDYWTGLVDEDTITVDLTPIGKHQKLYVEKIEDNRVYINNEGLFSGSISCFYTVWGERKDVGSLEIELDE